MHYRLSSDWTDLVFRLLFSLIFVGLGLEHLFKDELIRGMMPDWMGLKRLVSLGAGVILLAGGLSIFLGYKVREGGLLLGGFLFVVTLTIHAPALILKPEGLPDEWHWLWDVYQRSNFVKNLCLLGVCILLLRHQVGRFSLEAWLRRRKD